MSKRSGYTTGIIIGMLLMSILGLALDDIALGAMIGLPLGLAIGWTAAGIRNRRRGGSSEAGDPPAAGSGG